MLMKELNRFLIRKLEPYLEGELLFLNGAYWKSWIYMK